MKVYGPYAYIDKRGDTRFLVNLVDAGGRKTSQSYPRYLLEQHLGRKLQPDEDADHIDGNPANNDISNLRPLPLKENRGKHVLPAEIVSFSCPICGQVTQRLARRIRENHKRGCAGPFCGKKCSRAWQVQNKGL